MKRREEELARFFCNYIADQAAINAESGVENDNSFDKEVSHLCGYIIKQDAYINRIIGQMQDICEKHDIKFAIDGNRPSIG